MDNKEPPQNVKIVKDALGRPISRDKDKVYFVQLSSPATNVNDFFKEVQKEMKKKGFIKLQLEQPQVKQSFARVKIKPAAKVACTSIPQQFAVLKKILTNVPNDDLVNHEWKTILYCGYSGVYNPSENFIRFNDIDNIFFTGSEFKT